MTDEELMVKYESVLKTAYKRKTSKTWHLYEYMKYRVHPISIDKLVEYIQQLLDVKTEEYRLVNDYTDDKYIYSYDTYTHSVTSCARYYSEYHIYILMVKTKSNGEPIYHKSIALYEYISNPTEIVYEMDLPCTSSDTTTIKSIAEHLLKEIVRICDEDNRALGEFKNRKFVAGHSLINYINQDLLDYILDNIYITDITGISSQRAAKLLRKYREQIEDPKNIFPNDGYVHPWTFKGVTYCANHEREVWKMTEDEDLGDWVGVYLPKEDRIDETVPEPEYDE